LNNGALKAKKQVDLRTIIESNIAAFLGNLRTMSDTAKTTTMSKEV